MLKLQALDLSFKAYQQTRPLGCSLDSIRLHAITRLPGMDK
jgi:hypothetical protein